MSKRIEGGIIIWVALFLLSIASHYQSYSPFHCLFIYHITGREVVLVSDMVRRPSAGAFEIMTLSPLQDLLQGQAVP